ncbi:MAG: hypothetical protein G8345_21290, partial [Magnetococcales bacterium]|nr:hypothetical protein [Magnetococcales bacterium]
IEIVDRERPDLVNQFIRLRRDGRMPAASQPKKAPEVPAEEIHKRRLEKLERETYQKAFAAGEKAGLEMGEQRMRIMLEEAQQFLMQLQDIPNQVMTEVFSYSEELLVETAILLVRELLGHELTVNPEGIVHRVRQVLHQVAGRTHLVLHLSPRDAKILSEMPEFPHLTIEADPEISDGSVRLETDFGGVENRLDLQLQSMETMIRDYLRGRLEMIESQGVGEESAQDGEVEG